MVGYYDFTFLFEILDLFIQSLKGLYIFRMKGLLIEKFGDVLAHYE